MHRIGLGLALFIGMASAPIVPVCVLAALLAACGNSATEGMTSLSSGDGIDVSEFDSDGVDSEGEADESNGSADGGMADDGGASDCYHETFDITAEAPAVMLVLDKSSSMSDERWQHNGQSVTRWASLHAVVSDLVGTYDSTIDFGATLFPAVDAGHWEDGFDTACRVSGSADVLPMGSAGAAILGAMPGANETVQGATPARAGMLTAIAELAAHPGSRPRAALLVTDGLANCANEDSMFRYDTALPQVVGSAYDDQSIPTYVVGIDIRDEYVDYAQANAHEVLQEVAQRGGVPRDGQLSYYAAADETALYDALDEIAARIECTVPLSEQIATDAEFEVRVGDDVLTEVSDCSTESGWRFTDADQRNTIELCGQACDGLRIEGEVETMICEPAGLPIP